MKRNWKKYSQALARRGEIMLSFGAIESWSPELKEMNHKKEGRQFVYSESFMEALGYCHACLHLPFRQTEGLIKSRPKEKTKTPTYSAIWKRVSKSGIKMNPSVGKDIVIATGSTGVKAANRGEWMGAEMAKKKRVFLKFMCGSRCKIKADHRFGNCRRQVA